MSDNNLALYFFFIRSTAVTGKWADDFALRMKNTGLSCHVMDKTPWTVAMVEKHIWICAFMAIGAKHGCTVGEVERDYTVEVKSIINEFAAAAAKVCSLVLVHNFMRSFIR